MAGYTLDRLLRFLTAQSNILKWSNPIFFVVPDSAKDTPNGGMFIQAILEV